MNNAHFDKPVSIFVGLGFPFDVETVLQAYQVLTEWPFANRGPTYGVAHEMCTSALSDHSLTSAVRDAFEAFADERGVLASSAMEASVVRAAAEWLPV